MDCEQRENTDVLFSYFFETYKEKFTRRYVKWKTLIFINLILLILIKEKIKSNNIRH